MIQLLKISHILYFFLLCMFAAFGLIYQSSTDTELHVNIIILFSILLIPFWNYIYHLVVEIIQGYTPKNIGDILIDFGVPLFGISLGIGGFLNFEFLLFVGVILGLWRKYEGRIFFIGALILFCYVAFYLIFGQDAQSETLSIFAYYLLIAGVILQIRHSFLNPTTDKI